MVQTARPVSDTSRGSWSTNTGATTNLYATIDEAVADDSDYVQSSASPSSADVYKVALGSLTDPVSSSGHHVRYRYKKSVSGGARIDFTVRLVQGASTEIASWSHADVGSTYADADQTLSSGQADAITDYTALSLWFEAVTSGDFASDAFTDTDGTTLASHTPTGGGTWTLSPDASFGAEPSLVDGNRIRNQGGGMSTYYHSATPPDATYQVAADVVMRSDNDASYAGVVGRMTTGSAPDFYLARYSTVANAWQLVKIVGGAGTALGSDAAQTLTVDQPYRLVLSMVGTTIRLLVDGVEKVNVTDSSITAAGKAGVWTFGDAATATGVHLDNFAATDV